jgi:DNA polymerase I-like protein with 3'-5' exonuclease and polymerase domains
LRYYFGALQTGDPEIERVYDSLFSEPPSIVAIDTETWSVTNRNIKGIGMAIPGDHAFYFTWGDPSIPWHMFLNISPNITKVYQNAPFDVAWEILGMYGADIDNIEETTILTRMLNLPVALEGISDYVKNTTWSMGTYFERYDVKTVDELPEEALAEKCCRDCLVTLDTWMDFKDKVDWPTYLTERRFMSLLLHMSHRGMLLDKTKVNAIKAELDLDFNLYFGQARDIGFNPRSNDEVAFILSTEEGGRHIFNWKREAKHPTVDDDYLSLSPHPWAALTRIARKVGKMRTRVGKWQGNDRLRSHFRTDSSTWRVKSRGEKQKGQDNVQNLDSGRNVHDIQPKAGALRSIILPDPEPKYWFPIDDIEDDQPVFTKFDFSQIELRCFAYLADDEEMMWYLNYGLLHPDEPREKWPDFHRATMEAFKLNDRRPAKAFNFGMLYGGSDPVLAAATGIRNLNKIAEFRLAWERRWPKSAAYMIRARANAVRTLKVTSLFGRTLDLSQSQQTLTEKHVGNTGIAFPSQASAAEIFKRAALMLVDEYGYPPSHFSNNIHDEIWMNGRFIVPAEALSKVSQIWTPVESEYLIHGK